MDFVRSYYFPNATLTSWTLLDHFCHFWLGLLLLCCCTYPKVMTKMAKKCSTGQSCIRKEVTCYKIGTLVTHVRTRIYQMIIWRHSDESLITTWNLNGRIDNNNDKIVISRGFPAALAQPKMILRKKCVPN